MPFQILALWLRGLFALALVAAGISLLGLWYRQTSAEVRIERPARHEQADNERPADTDESSETAAISAPWFGFNRQTAYLCGGLALTQPSSAAVH
jgi:hypothetical protein